MSMAAAVLPPILREGDPLTSEEFLLRWEAMPDLKHAELIDGIVHMPSPVSVGHGDYHTLFDLWVATYMAATPGCRAGSDTTWLMSQGQVPQPDIALRILPEFGGRSRLEGPYAAGSPELIIEIAASSRSKDLGPKLALYQSSGVPEYITFTTRDQSVIWRELAEGRYRPLTRDARGVIKSRTFPGLWLDTEAAARLDAADLIATLRRGLRTAAHRNFVAHLGKTAG